MSQVKCNNSHDIISCFSREKRINYSENKTLFATSSNCDWEDDHQLTGKLTNGLVLLSSRVIFFTNLHPISHSSFSMVFIP